jgi:hypothetical protein
LGVGRAAPASLPPTQPLLQNMPVELLVGARVDGRQKEATFILPTINKRTNK